MGIGCLMFLPIYGLIYNHPTAETTKQAKEIQEEFKDHFMKEGSIPWQWRSAQIIS